MSKFHAVFEDVSLKLTPAISGFVNSAALESEVRGTRSEVRGTRYEVRGWAPRTLWGRGACMRHLLKR